MHAGRGLASHQRRCANAFHRETNDVLRNGEGCQHVIAEAFEKRRALSFLK
jgi:hypothetical protein